MIQKLIHTNDFKPPPGIADYGNSNQLPTPYVEIVEDEFIWYTHQLPRFIEYRQITSLWPTMREAHIQWHYDYGLAIIRPVNWQSGEPHPTYVDKVQYFYLGCFHRWEERPTREMHHHHSVCVKCGAERHTDSSG
jgi:hypothetical protein